jgi:predicted transcriptional regulator
MFVSKSFGLGLFDYFVGVKSNMKFILYTFPSSFGNTSNLCVELIPMGIECLEADSQDKVFKLLNKNNSINIVLTENYEKAFIQKLKELFPKLYVFLIVKSNLDPLEIMLLKEMGITSLINFSNNAYSMAEEILHSLIYNNIKSPDKRFHVRIRPKEHEGIRSTVFIKRLNRFFKGKVLNISAGGVAIRFNDSLEASLLEPKIIYDPLIIFMQGTEVKTMSTMIARKDTIAGFKFENVEHKHMMKIASYIYCRVSALSKNLLSQVFP